MGTLKKLTLAILIIISTLTILYVAIKIVVVLKQGYTWEEMDWNQNQSVSFGELFIASDVGKRTVIINDEDCTEYYALKDGLPIKTICPAK